MQYRKDKSGNELSMLGYGCMRFTRNGREIDLPKAEKEIMAAYRAGVNYYDTAYIYQGSEAALVGLKAMPRIAVLSLKIAREGEKAWIDAEIANLGFLPASGTKNAAEKGLGTEITVTLAGCEALGENPVILDTIEGYSRKLVRFPVKLPPEGEITVTVSGVRCGKVQASLRVAGSKGGKA